VAELLYLSAGQIAALITPPDLIAAERRALTQLSQGAAQVPARGSVPGPGGMIEYMPGYLPGQGYGAKLVSYRPANPAQGLPLHSALITLFDPDTGRPDAVLSAGPLTALRTAAVSAVTTSLLARPAARVLAILGSGAQAAAHLEYLLTVRDFTEVRVSATNSETAAALAARFPQAELAAGAQEAVRGADVVCCCTSSVEPVVQPGWVAPGTHLISVGMGREFGPELIRRARMFAETRAAVQAPYPSGALEAADLPATALTEIGEVLAGTAPGRSGPDELTLFKSVGHAAEDLAAAHLVCQLARDRGLGQLLPL
jgi:alanine dehydrogenase